MRSFGNIFKLDIPICIKRKTNVYMLTKGRETLTMKTLKKLRVTQTIARSMLDAGIRYKIPNTEIRRRTSGVDAVTRITPLNWNWAKTLR